MRHLATTAAVSLAAVLLVPAGASAASVASAASAGPATAARRALAGLQVAAPDRSPANESVASGPHIAGTTALKSGNWSGWADDNTAAATTTYTAVSGHWKQPAVKCIRTNDTEIAVFWVGIDGFSSNTVEQDGTVAVCLGGVPAYFSWWEMYPTNSIQIVGAVNPGDAISSKVTFKAGNYHLAVTDTTTASGSFTRTEKCGAAVACVNSSAEWIAERPSSSAGLFVLPHFATWKVMGASTTSATIGHVSAFPDDEITMVNASSKVLASPSALNATGAGFSVTWKASA